MPTRRAVFWLTLLFAAHAAASLFHFTHNAEFLGDYPNMPATFTRAGVYAAWLGVTSIGLCGCLLVRWRYPAAGLILLGIYGFLGLDGLAHYALAPMSAHTTMMNMSIWLEVCTALLLIAAVVMLGMRRSANAKR